MADHYALEEKRYHRDLNVPEGVDPVEFLSDKPELFDMSAARAFPWNHVRSCSLKALVALKVSRSRALSSSAARTGSSRCPSRVCTRNCIFVGVDFMPFAARVARRIAEKGITNVEFHSGGMDKLIELGPFDIALAPKSSSISRITSKSLNDLVWSLTEKGSVDPDHAGWQVGVERVETYTNARQHLHRLRAAGHRGNLPRVQPDHCVCTFRLPTVPTARWLVGLQHPEQPKERCIPSTMIGSWRWPHRETVSLCMIVRNAEEHIVASLRSAVQWVDEVVIAVDNTTTDRTRERIADDAG